MDQQAPVRPQEQHRLRHRRSLEASRRPGEGGRRILTYLALLVLFTGLSLALVAVFGSEQAAGGFVGTLVMWSPGVAALVTVFSFQRNLKGMGWRPGKPRYLLLGYGLPLVDATLVYGAVWLLGFGALRGHPLGVAEAVVAVTPGVLAGALGGLGEEIGWRGLLVPELARLTTFTRTALISGVIWAVWHWPFVLFAGYNSGAPLGFTLSVFTLNVLLGSFALAWLRLRSGSLWPAVLAHTSWNLYLQSVFDPLTRDTGATEYIAGEFGVAFGLTGAIYAYVFWRLGQRLPEAAPAPELPTS